MPFTKISHRYELRQPLLHYVCLKTLWYFMHLPFYKATILLIQEWHHTWISCISIKRSNTLLRQNSDVRIYKTVLWPSIGKCVPACVRPKARAYLGLACIVLWLCTIDPHPPTTKAIVMWVHPASPQTSFNTKYKILVGNAITKLLPWYCNYWA